MMKTKKTLMTAVALCMAAMVMLAGCSKSTNSSSTTGTKTAETTATTATTSLEPYAIDWYIACDGTTKDADAVSQAISDLPQVKAINATIKLHFMTVGDYGKKLDMMLASGEKLDILSSFAWAEPYNQNVAKGNFLEVTPLLDKVAPQYKSALPQILLDACKINGKVYGLPTIKEIGASFGFVVRKDIADSIGMDGTALKNIDDFAAFVEKAHKQDSNLGITGFFQNGISFSNVVQVGGWGYGVYKYDDKSAKVYNLFDDPDFLHYSKVMHQLYTDGCVLKESTISGFDISKFGDRIIGVTDSLKPGINVQVEGQVYNNKYKCVVSTATPIYFDTANATTVMNAISRTSEDPERAMMFLQLANTDEQVCNMINFGIEGKHYTKTGSKNIEINPDAAYNPGETWGISNNLLCYYVPGQQDGLWDEYRDFNKGAIPSPTLGFSFDTTPVKTEVGACNNVIATFNTAISSGMLNPDTDYPKIKAKLQQAGMDKIIDEEQKQIDAWKASNSK